MFYIVLTVILSLLGAFTFIPKYRDIIERYNTGVNFVLTLLATLIGVLLAISITNYDAQQNEKQDVIKLLNAAIASVAQCEEYSEELVEYFDTLPEEQRDEILFFDKNPPPYPEYLDVFLTQNIVSKNLSGEMLNELNEYLINLKRTRGADPRLYAQLLDLTEELLRLEIEYQQGNKNQVQLQRALSAVTAQLNTAIEAAK